MIEREHHRVEYRTNQRSLAAHLAERQSDLVELIAITAFERGYARYVPDLHNTLRAAVHGMVHAIGDFLESETVAAFHPGEVLGNDPLVAFIRRERLALCSRGVPMDVFFGLLQQCRSALTASLLEAPRGHPETFRALLELCFDRMELAIVTEPVASRVVHAAESNSEAVAPLTVGHESVSPIAAEVERQVTERCRAIVAANERLRRELDRRLRVDDERELYYRALLHSQKLEAVGSLAGGVAHDLNNLFQVIRCDIDTLRKRSDSASFGILEEVSHVTERAVGLVRQLLLFSRKQPMARRVLDVGEVVADLLRLLRRVMPENIRLRSEVEAKLPALRADLSAIEQLVMNLVINARDSMPQGGTIQLSVRAQRRVPPDRIRAASSIQQVAIIVRDDGMGMPDEVLARIFDPFFTTKNHSSGLGLSVVHGVVEEHGGWVEVSSTPGHGSCFAIYLPVLDVSAVDEEEPFPVAVGGCPGLGEHLLLVEDEEVVRRALGRELTQQGYRVQCVGSAEEALTIYRRAPGHFDCVISDGLMPGMSGPEMVLEMLKENAGQRAIFISGYAPTLDSWKDLQSRGYRLLAKPFGTAELISALKETLGDGREASAETLRANVSGRDT